jgi:hypothetical protein
VTCFANLIPIDSLFSTFNTIILPFFILYTTADDKIIPLRDIKYIDAIKSLDDGTMQYKVFQKAGDFITVTHTDAEVLAKDRRKLELTWEKYLKRN